MATLQQFLQDTETGSSFSPERRQRIERVLIEDHKSDMPWYLRFMVGVGAWLASAFFIGFFLALVGWEENHRVTLGVSGLVLLVVSTLLFRQKFGLFVNQCCLAASFAGQFMIYYGFLPEQHHTLGSAVVLSVSLAAALYWLYPDVLQRLVTCVAALQIILAWIYLGNNGEGLFSGAGSGHDIVFWASLYWVVQLTALVACLLSVNRWTVSLSPLAHALVIALAAWQVENLAGLWTRNEIIPLLTANHATVQLATWPFYLRPIFTAVMLFGVVVWAAGGTTMVQRFALPFIGFIGALIAIIWLGAGGILLPLLLVILGFLVESRVIQGIGLLLLPVFLFTYYYNLHLDLMAKSVALIGTGLALLLLRAGFRRWLTAATLEAS